ncbi:MAG: DUF2281 domain-containing protein [Chloroflexi bacterium]|nr:DUF2281 domain-containing protein [Chloroflexota bacterium]
MALSKITQDINSLPPEAQRQVADFVAFLQERYSAAPAKRTRKVKIAKEPFVGMWKDRADMLDSVAWVRQTRRSQWRNRG